MSQQKPGSLNEPDPEKVLSSTIQTEFHALSNALEVIVQSSYLISTTCTDANSKKWIATLNDGVERAVSSQRALRRFLAQCGKLPPVKE